MRFEGRVTDPASLQLRPACLDDADLLLAWRNDATTRQASHDTSPVSHDVHVAWLRKTLSDPHRQLYVAERDGRPVGTVRVDAQGAGHLLSWTVAPKARGSGLGSAMVAKLASSLPGPIWAEIKVGNTASIRIAQAAGMALDREQDGVLYYRR